MPLTFFPKRTNFFRLFLYLLFAVAALFLHFVGDNGEPLALALLYALSGVGFSPIISAFLCALPSVFSLDPFYILLFLGQALLIATGQILQSKLPNPRLKKSGLISLIFLSISLALFVAFAPFTPYHLPFPSKFTPNALTQKVVLAAGVFLFSAVFSVALKALLHKFLKCQLRPDERIFCVLFFFLVGVGICRFLGVNAYMGTAIFILLLFSYTTKDASGLLCAFFLSLPPLLTAGHTPTKFFLYGAVVCVFIKSGRLSAACALLAAFFAYGYWEGLYQSPTPQLVSATLSVVIPTLLFALIPTPAIRFLENQLIYYRERHLSRIAINRNRAAVGEKLFEISAVFREIQTTFTALGAAEADRGAKEYLRDCIIEEVCKNCAFFPVCQKRNLHAAFEGLVGVGCLKGKVSLVDIPRALAEGCNNQSGLLYALNRRLGEYKNYVTETENAATGRALLAGQAQGVSEILKNLALEQSEPLQLYTDKEKTITSPSPLSPMATRTYAY